MQRIQFLGIVALAVLALTLWAYSRVQGPSIQKQYAAMLSIIPLLMPLQLTCASWPRWSAQRISWVPGCYLYHQHRDAGLWKGRIQAHKRPRA
jgi:hypothetical protein